MLPPSNRTITIAPGATALVGRTTAIPAPGTGGGGAIPSWLSSQPLNEWHPVPNSAGAGGSAVAAYGAFALEGTNLWIAAQGGHGDSSDNRVVKLALATETPAWELKQGPTTGNPDQPYSNGAPSSRHGYYGTHYSATVDKVLLIGCNFVWPDAYQFPVSDGFSPKATTFAWDNPGTYAYGVANYPAPVSGVYSSAYGGRYGVVMANDGKIWTEHAEASYDPATNTWLFGASTVDATTPRYPWANNTTGNYLFGMSYGTGIDTSENSIRIKKQVGGVKTSITMNASAALTQFLADQQAYGGLVFNLNNGKALWYGGNVAGRMWEITVNSDNTADMAAFAYGAGSVTPPSTGASGICGRFKFCPELNCLLLLPTSGGSVYFLRLG